MARDLSRLVYRSFSRIAHDDVPGLDVIFRTSIANNRRDGITGCLALPDGHFVQVIEGETARVERLMARISADDRHEQVCVLGEWPIRGRLFTGWAMARPDPEPMSGQAFKVCTQDGSGVQVTSVLLDLMEARDRLYPTY